MSDWDQFKASIPNCVCHCRECCECDKPVHVISISNELRSKMSDPKIAKAIMTATRIMEIPGATNVYGSH